MVFFPNEKIELWEYTENSEIPNFFGETTVSYNLIGTYDADIQPMSPKDNPNEYGKLLEDTFKIYFNPDVPIMDTMILRIVGRNDTYSITGTPINNNHILPHIKVIVQKQRKPTPLD